MLTIFLECVHIGGEQKTHAMQVNNKKENFKNIYLIKLD